MPSVAVQGSRNFAALAGLLAFFVFLGSLGAPGQTGDKTPAGTQNETPFPIKVASNLVVVRVVVRDARGVPVEGLKKEDFHLFDRGKEQTIIQFEIEGSASTSSSSTPNAPGQALASPARRGE